MQVQRQIDELLALRASEWLELLPTASVEQLRAFDAWLSESRLHVQEFLEIAEVEFCLGSLDIARRHDIDALLERIAPAVAALPRQASPGPFPVSRSRRWLNFAGAAAACTVLALTATLAYLNHGNSNRHATAIGEQRTVKLADASVVTLSADSRISVHFRESNREIDLPRGEAIFNVSHDSRRPFRVHTRAGIVQAVGTQFNVHNRFNGDTSVSVLEGRVRALSHTGNALTLSAGEEADIRLDGTVHKHNKPAVADAVAWREHRLVFENAPLEEMAAEFNRYNRFMRLRLEGLQDDARRYDGSFRATDPNSLADLLARDPGLSVERRGAEIVISRR